MPRSTDAAPLLELVSVGVSSGSYEPLTDLSVAFSEGETTVMLGNAGSGKSTFLKTVAGLLVPDRGAVNYRGRNIHRFNRNEELAFRADTGFVFQDGALWSDTSILDNVTMPLRIHRPSLRRDELAEAAGDTLSRLGYRESLTARPADLSAGEQKLVSIARAIIHDPSIVFMDDPTANLDEDATELLFGLIEALKSRGKTIIVSANHSDLAYRFADCLGVIREGTMRAFGRYDETIAGSEAALIGSISRLKARGERRRSIVAGHDRPKESGGSGS